jgi:hypothetical protein
MAVVSLKREETQRIRQEGFRAGNREMSIRDFQRVAKNQGLDLVEGATSSETEKETADTAGAGNVKAPAQQLDIKRERE